MIDLVLAGDNAVVVGTIAAGLPKAQQKKVVFVGVAAALVLRIVFALAATQLLQVIGLLFAGGLLLLWVAWKMWRELRAHDAHATESDIAPRAKTFAGAAWAVALADVSMSRSEEHTSELQSLMRISYAVFCLKKKKYTKQMT